MTGHELLFDGRPCRVVMAIDVSERRRLEEQLRLAQRMEAVGQLAGGIAHDFNNLLMVINGFSELLVARLPPGDELEAAQQIRTAGDRAAALTKQLLAFGSPGIVRPETLNLADLIGGLLPMLERSFGVQVEIAFSATARAPWVEADRAQLEQVLVNLAVNAHDAMPEGGRLSIELEDASGDHPEAMASAHGMLLLSVSDTGRGIEEAIRERVFLPFFTTKADRGSSGLGLATVFSTVRASGGRIWVDGDLTPGTTIRVLLPRAATPPSGAYAGAGADPGAGRPNTILVVEDEPAVLTLLERVLSGAGYVVVTASSGVEALAVTASRAPATSTCSCPMPSCPAWRASSWPASSGSNGQSCRSCSCPVGPARRSTASGLLRLRSTSCSSRSRSRTSWNGSGHCSPHDRPIGGAPSRSWADERGRPAFDRVAVGRQQ